MRPFQKAKNKKSKSPLKAPPLRSAGQSVDDEINRLINEEISSYAAILVVAFIFPLYEWISWYGDLPHTPIAMSLLGLIVAPIAGYKVRKFKKQIKTLRLGRDGEKAVGEFLDRFRESGYRVFHDIVGGNFNIDHILIGTTGIYTIKTKAISKPTQGNPKIICDGDQVTIGNFEPDRNPITQAKAQANWLKELITELTGNNIKVHPIVLYPGWYVEQKAGQSEVWVLNPKALPKFLENMKPVIDPTHIPSIAAMLSRWVRHSY